MICAIVTRAYSVFRFSFLLARHYDDPVVRGAGYRTEIIDGIEMVPLDFQISASAQTSRVLMIIILLCVAVRKKYPKQ